MNYMIVVLMKYIRKKLVYMQYIRIFVHDKLCFNTMIYLAKLYFLDVNEYEPFTGLERVLSIFIFCSFIIIRFRYRFLSRNLRAPRHQCVSFQCYRRALGCSLPPPSRPCP